MAIATLTTRGRVTLPKELREAANLQPGDRIQFTFFAEEKIILLVKNNRIEAFPVRPSGRKPVSVEKKKR